MLDPTNLHTFEAEQSQEVNRKGISSTQRLYRKVLLATFNPHKCKPVLFMYHQLTALIFPLFTKLQIQAATSKCNRGGRSTWTSPCLPGVTFTPAVTPG